MRSKVIFLALALSAALAGCAEEQLRHKAIRDIVRIFMHEPSRYTFYIRWNETEIQTETLRIFDGKPLIKTDVPPYELPWVEFDSLWYSWTLGDCTKDSPCLKNVVFHLRSVDDVSGGGWNHGKFGRGQTTIIE